jgi:Chain length determinant protein
MPNDVTPLNTEDEGLNLWELLDVVKSGWHWLAGGAAIGLAGAVGFVMVVPAQYEATAIIQPAKVGMSTTTTTKGAEVESTAQTLERLKLPTFYTENLIKACEIKQEVGARQGLAKAMKPTLVKGNSLIQITYRAESPAIAEACVAGVVAQLAKVQASLAEPIIKTLEEQRQLTKLQLDESERFQSQIEKRAMSLDPSDAKFSQSMLMLNAALSKREEISKLRKLYTEQSMQLVPPLTQPTQLFEPIDASEKAVFPKKTLSALGGLVSGLVLGGLLLFVRRSWSRFKAI